MCCKFPLEMRWVFSSILIVFLTVFFCSIIRFRLYEDQSVFFSKQKQRMWLRGVPRFYCFKLKCWRVSPNRRKRGRSRTLCLIFLLLVVISMNFIDFTETDTGASGQILRILKQIHNLENEGPVVLKVRDGVLEKDLRVATDVFQNITTDGRLLVYNAYIDGPRENFIRAFGFTNMSTQPETNLRCLFWDTDMNPLISMETNVTMEILPFHLERYRNVIYTCPNPAQNTTVVTIKTNTSTVKESQNLLKIIVSPKLNRTFTICLRPIHFNRSIAFDIVEWVEYYRLMGVEHFVIYNFTSDPLTNKILNYYINKGFLTVVQWQVPYHVIPKNHYYDLVKHNELHSVGQFTMLNDFLYRVYWSTKFIVNVDLDEFIVPMGGLKNFTQLLNKLPGACEYLIRNTLVPLKDELDTDGSLIMDLAKQYYVKTALFRKKRNYIFDTKWKTKYIAETNCLQALWLHYVLEKRETNLLEQHVVDTKTVLVFHYRKEYEKKLFKRGTRDIEDKSMEPFLEQIVQNVKSAWDIIGLPMNHSTYHS